jgi:hypothetical protein
MWPRRSLGYTCDKLGSGRGSRHVELQPRLPPHGVRTVSGKDRIICENAIDSDIGPISAACIKASLPGRVRTLGQKPNEAATHGNVGGSRTVLKAAEPQQNENFQGLAQHESFGRRTLESWRKAEKQWDPCFCCTVDIRCRRQGRTHMRQAYQCR